MSKEKPRRYATHRFEFEGFQLPMPLCIIGAEGQFELQQLEEEAEAILFLPGSFLLLASDRQLATESLSLPLEPLSLEEMRKMICSAKAGNYTLWHRERLGCKAKMLEKICLK